MVSAPFNRHHCRYDRAVHPLNEAQNSVQKSEATSLDLIHEARTALTKPDGTLQPWEAEEIGHAEAAVYDNWLRVALFAMEKAIAVSQLPPDEYEYGFNYTKPKT
jgi:hypothetical protein